MSLLLYRFDDAEAFPLLETETTAQGSVMLGAEGDDVDACLRVQLRRKREERDQIKAVIGLSLVAVGGEPQNWILDVVGDASGALLELEAGDRGGSGLTYSLGCVDFLGRRTCRAPVQSPAEYWGKRKGCGTQGVLPPVQPFRLAFILGERCEGIDLRLVALEVDGDAQLVPPGIALGPHD